MTWDQLPAGQDAGSVGENQCLVRRATGAYKPAVMRILFVGPSRIGDAVLASGLLNHLVTSHPDARFTVACGVAAAPLFEAVPGLEQLIPMTKLARSGHWWRLWRQVVRRRWSLVVDVRRSVIPWTVLTGRRAIAPASSDDSEHAIVFFARSLGLTEDPPAPKLWLGPEHRASAQAHIPDGSPVLAIGPTANWEGKIWPAARFVETIERITAPARTSPEAVMPGARVVLFGAESERAAAQSVIDAVPEERRIDLVGRVDLLTVAACLERCGMYIGNDSGLMHLAATSGTPTLGLFGPSRPERYAPWGAHTAWVRTQKSLEEMVSAPGYDHRTTGTLMDTLSVDDVVAAASSLWQRTGGRST